MASIDIDYLLSELTINEKISLLTGSDFWHTTSIPRLKIPSLRMSDGPNGIRGTRFFNGVPAACFPCGTALGATWDAPLLEKAGKLMADEARAKGVHVILGPTVNMQRSPLGGRGFESVSEDPLLSGSLAAAEIRGIQSQGIIATIKHFICNDQEHERKAVNAIVSDRALREIYLMPFQIALRESEPLALMSSYNKVNGIHASEDPKLLQHILRNEWGFDGLIVSDWFGTYSVSEAMNAGLDVEMPGPGMWRGVLVNQALRANKISSDTIDDRVRSILKMIKHAVATGIEENAPEGGLDTPETAQTLRELSAASIVLLKNAGNILPFNPSKTTAVIGPNAKVATFCGGGSASLRPYYTTTPYNSILKKVGQVKYAVGAHSYKLLPLLNGQLKTVRGQPGFDLRIYNQPPSILRREVVEQLVLDNTSVELVDYKHPAVDTKTFYADFEGVFVAEEDGEFQFGLAVFGTAKLYVDGELLIDNATNQTLGSFFFGAGTIEETQVLNMKAGTEYRILVQFGSAYTQTKMKTGVTAMGAGGFRVGGAKKTDFGSEIQRAVKVAKEVDQVIICAGLSSEWEAEGYDRDNMDLPAGTDEMISAVLAANPNTAVVIQSGTPVGMPWVDDASAILQAWYGGNEGGNAIADVIFGDVTPSAKLPLTFPIRNEDNPAFLNFRSERGRAIYGEDVYIGYRFYEKTKKSVLFPFGHGLSYTRFKMTNLSIKETADDMLKVEVDVLNEGEVGGAEVVQVYVRQHSPSLNRPNKELKGYSKVSVPKGESRSVGIMISKKFAASFWDEAKNMWIMEKDKYEVLVGPSSAEIVLQGSFEIKKTLWWKGP